MKRNILVVEDEKHIAEGVRLNLTLSGHEVSIADNGKKAIEMWEANQYDLIVLDLMLPILDGYQVLEIIRKKDERVPILILSAKDAARDKVKCFNSGVDDYLSKPFNLDEFLLRIDRLLIKKKWLEEGSSTTQDKSFEDDEFSFGNVRVDFKNSMAHVLENSIELTSQELKLLHVFISNEGEPLSRKQLLELAWGYEGNISTRTVDNFLVRFRRYFEEDSKNPKHFLSRRSVGYVFKK